MNDQKAFPKNDDYNSHNAKIILTIISFFIGSISLNISLEIIEILSSLQLLSEIIRTIILMVNIWGLGFLFNELFLASDFRKKNLNNIDVYINDDQIIIKFILLPITFGIILFYSFGLVSIILINILEVTEIIQRQFIILFVFYLIEFILIIYFIFLYKNALRSILISLGQSLLHLNPNRLKYNFIKINIRIIFSTKTIFIIFSLLIILISFILGEINYNSQFFNLILVYLFFLLIIIVMILYFKLENKTTFLNIFFVFILVFALVHLFISRGPTIVGRTDIHKEFFYAQHTLDNVNWDPNEFSDNYNTILSISIFPMLLSLIFGIQIGTFFEIVNPTIFGLFNIGNYIILRKLHLRYLGFNSSDNNKVNGSSSILIIYSIFSIIFIRSYTHIIAASSRIVIAYFIFIVLCLLILEDRHYFASRQLSVTLLLFISVLLSHWGTFLFGFIIILFSYIILIFFKIINNRDFLMEYSKLIGKNLLKIYVILGAFSILVIIWFFLIAPRVMIFIHERVFSTVGDFLIYGTEDITLKMESLISSYRIFDLSNPLLGFETIINLIFLTIIVISNVFKINKINKIKNARTFDFFGFSTIFCMGLMFLIPILSLFYSPLRVGMQFWPFIAPITFPRVKLPDLKFINSSKIQLLKKRICRLNYFTFFYLFLILLFHQGIVYNIAYNSGYISSSEVFEINDGFSLIFENYGVEAWRWILTESDIQAIEWLDKQSPQYIYADLSRTYMLYSRINGTSPEDTTISNSLLPLIEFYKTNGSIHISKLRNSYFFFSSQNVDTGLMFFSNTGQNITKILVQLEQLNASLVYSNQTLIYYLPI